MNDIVKEIVQMNRKSDAFRGGAYHRNNNVESMLDRPLTVGEYVIPSASEVVVWRNPELHHSADIRIATFFPPPSERSKTGLFNLMGDATVVRVDCERHARIISRLPHPT